MQVYDIQAFLAIVQTKSMIRAAEYLNLSQSSITHRLKSLEKSLGLTLFDRKRGMKNIYLTPAGEDFLPLAERWFALSKEAEIFKQQGDKLVLSIGTLESLNFHVLPSLFNKLSQHTPKIRLEITTKHTLELYSLVERRQIDVAFVLRDIFSHSIIRVPWGTAPMVVLKAGNPAVAGTKTLENKSLNPDDELYIPWSGVSFDTWHDQWWNPVCPGRIKIMGISLIFPMLNSPQKWIVVPLWVAQYALTLGNFTYYLLTDPPPERVVYKITHKFPKPSTQRSLAVFDKYLSETNLS
jgi:DNA-binding transcriptional LysR family regulator